MSLPNEAYCVICPNCGRVQIGQRGYDYQMSHPNQCWFCPQCKGWASFDDETYEEYAFGKNST